MQIENVLQKNKLVRKPSANSKHLSGELSMILQTVLKFLRHDNVTSCSKNILALHWFSNWFIFWKDFRFALIFRTNVFFHKKRKTKNQFPLKINTNGIKIHIKNNFHWKSMKTLKEGIGTAPLRILPQIVFSYFWSFPQIVKINLRLPQIVFWLWSLSANCCFVCKFSANCFSGIHLSLL